MFIGLQEILVLLAIVLFLILLHKFCVRTNVNLVKRKYVISKKIRFFIVISFIWLMFGGGVILHWFGEDYSNFVFMIMIPMFILWGTLWICNGRK